MYRVRFGRQRRKNKLNLSLRKALSSETLWIMRLEHAAAVALPRALGADGSGVLLLGRWKLKAMLTSNHPARNA